MLYVIGWRNGIRVKLYRIEITELDEDPVLATFGVRMDYYRNYKIYYVADNENSVVYVIRILHMLVDSRMWLYKTFRVIEE